MVQPDFGVEEFADLHGGGMFFADPSQVVVIDSVGYLLAAAPQPPPFLVRRLRSGVAPICLSWGELRGLCLSLTTSDGRVVVRCANFRQLKPMDGGNSLLMDGRLSWAFRRSWG